MPKSHCGRYRLAPNGPDKEKQKNNIFSPLGEMAEEREERRRSEKASVAWKLLDEKLSDV